MGVEIEAKMRLASREQMISRLQEAGAKPVAELSETNSYFDTADGELKSTDQGLRTRIEVVNAGSPNERVVTTITHKGPRAHGVLKSRDESELVVDNARDAAELLGALGYHHVLTFEKRRTRYELDACRVELDELPVLGSFIEIEGPSEAEVLAVREKLALSNTPVIKSSYIAMLKSHLQETHNESVVMKFQDGKSVLKD